MKSSNQRAQLAAVPALFLFLATTALAQTDCSAEIAEIDRRIATGNYSTGDVQMARQMRAAFNQMCMFLDAESRAGMMGDVEKILPTKSEAERLAELNPSAGPVLLAAPTGRSITAEAVVRGDPMNQFWLWDWDVFEGRLRVLYSSFPNTAFFALPDWRFNVYVTEMTPAGGITHRLITSKQAADHAGLALRRGFDEILFHRQDGKAAALERWSISNTRMLATVDISGRTLSMNSEVWVRRGFPMATSDGNILYVARKMGTAQDDRMRIGWFKFSPGGAELASGTATEIKDDFDIWSMFHTSNGGAGLLVNITPGRGDGTPTKDVASAFGFLGSAAGGKRALIVDGKANLTFASSKLDGNRPATTPAATTAEQTQSQVMFLAAQFGASRSILTSNVGPHRLDAIKETSRGYAYLAKVNAGGNDTPRSDGLYLIEFDASGETNEIYLQPIVETLNFTAKNFAPSPDGRFYLYGYGQSRGDSHVVLIDREGNPIARSRTTFDSSASIADIVADASGVWLLGQTGYGSDQNLWLERIEIN